VVRSSRNVTEGTLPALECRN